LQPPAGPHLLLAFTSTRRFGGKFYLRQGSPDVVVDTESLEIAPGEKWDLEEFQAASGATRPDMLDALAARLVKNHPPLRTSAPPNGWCSCFGPRVTARQVMANLDFIASNIPGLKYIQIDDGYQPAMGDWLETGAAFGGDVQGVLGQIRERGFAPAIWVAPFVAEENSRLFREHPDWSIKDDPKATRIEAYRRGMQAILKGSQDGFILGCNHPIWPSIGLIHGSRRSGDINRRWRTFERTARENLNRAWQNGKLWCNDPDVVCRPATSRKTSSGFTRRPSTRPAGCSLPATI
jgi:alpha-galactosidase